MEKNTCNYPDCARECGEHSLMTNRVANVEKDCAILKKGFTPLALDQARNQGRVNTFMMISGSALTVLCGVASVALIQIAEHKTQYYNDMKEMRDSIHKVEKEHIQSLTGIYRVIGDISTDVKILLEKEKSKE